MTFRELAVGDRFVFVRDLAPDSVLRDPFDPYYVKTGAETFERRGPTGAYCEGRVGAGDNPVQRVQS